MNQSSAVRRKMTSSQKTREALSRRPLCCTEGEVFGGEFEVHQALPARPRKGRFNSPATIAVEQLFGKMTLAST